MGLWIGLKATVAVVVVLLLGACRSATETPPATSGSAFPETSVAPAALDEVVLPDYEMVERRDISYDFGPGDSATRLSIRVEIPQWPVTKDQLQALADQLIEAERGQGWQAINISMGADRDESLAAYAVFEWAPGGDWARAHEGDPDTWAGYEYSIQWGNKMENPQQADCKKPSPLAFQYNKELWAAGLSKSEKQIMRDIAERHDDTPEHVRDLLEDVLEWEFC